MRTDRITETVMEIKRQLNEGDGDQGENWMMDHTQEIGREKGKALEEMKVIAKNRRKLKKFVQQELTSKMGKRGLEEEKHCTHRSEDT